MAKAQLLWRSKGDADHSLYDQYQNLPAIMQKIVDGTAPPKFTVAHLKAIVQEFE